MATGRIGVTPTLGTRWSKAPSAGTTSLSGLDDNSVSLVYSVGYEQVYRNGVLLSRGNDYTATSGNSITLTDATVNGDIIEVFANELVPLTDAISKGQFTAKGSLLSASAASTPAVLAVGSNDQVLTADSSTTTGLKWATPAAGGMTLLASGSLSGASVTLSSISGSYNDLRLYCRDASVMVIYDDNTGGNYDAVIMESTSNNTAASLNTYLNNSAVATYNDYGATDALLVVDIFSYATSGVKKIYQYTATGGNNIYRTLFSGRGTSALTEIVLTPNSGTWSAGTYELWGIK